MSQIDAEAQAVFEETLQLVSAALPETALLRCAGQYDVPVDASVGSITGVRIDQRARRPVSLATFDIVGHRIEGAVRSENAEPEPGELAWVELIWTEPVPATAVALGNAADSNVHRAAKIRVSVRSADGTWHVVLDTAARLTSWRAERRVELASRFPDDPQLAYLNDLLVGVVGGEYGKARVGVQKQTPVVPAPRVAAMRLAANPELLASRQREWTTHGIQRSFRFWTEDEKRDYVRYAADVAHDLTSLTPNVCFGFGAALAVVRENDLIPHDDDLDLIIAFEPQEAANLPAALERVAEHLTPLGYAVSGEFFAHCHVRSPGRGKKIDVFVGLIEGDEVSWHPGPRTALHRADVFPASTGSVFGVEVPLPADPEGYLASQYGPDWRTPDPNFKHNWKRSRFDEQGQRKRRPATPPAKAPVWHRRVLGRLRRELRRLRGR